MLKDIFLICKDLCQLKNKTNTGVFVLTAYKTLY